MSPIGRVFIVLNCLMAGLFVGFAGTYLQRQDSWKKKYEAEHETLTATVKKDQADLAKANESITQADAEKIRLNGQLANANKENKDLADNNKALEDKLANFQADLKLLASGAQAVQSSVSTAFTQSKEALDKAIAADQAKDAAIREKDDAVAKHREATQKIKELTDAGMNKDVQIATLSKEKGELGLLVDAAKTKGFLESMATPALAGTVTLVNGRLVTISVTDNPSKAEIKPGFRFAVYDGSSYKGEARVTSSDSEKGVAFCTLDIQKGEVKIGDKASTQTN